ncbi:BCL-2-associated athanogene 7 [Wolffia australiana]
MSWCRRLELLESPYSLFYADSCLQRSSLLPFPSPLLFDPEELDLPFPWIRHPFASPSPLDLLDEDLRSIRRFQERTDAEIYLRSLADRVSALELGFDRALLSSPLRDRKYTWTAETKGSLGGDRKYKVVAEAAANGEKSLKVKSEIKDKDKASRIYSFQTSSSPAAVLEKKKKTKKKVAVKEEKAGTSRLVEITDEADQGAVVLRQAFAKRTSWKGKKKELSQADAALLIQMTFREHLVRRSLVLRGLRELAIAKAKLREIRALFSNFSYRQRVAKDAEERQRFSEKIIVLLLTVDAIEGADYMVRAARRSMVEELELMLDLVDPQPQGRLGLLRRRKFDLPSGGAASREIALGVSEVVQMLNDAGTSG